MCSWPFDEATFTFCVKYMMPVGQVDIVVVDIVVDDDYDDYDL